MSKLTCRNRYDKFIATKIAKEHCSTDDKDGEPLVPYQPCSNIKDCDALWDELCSENCPRRSFRGLQPCKNADGTGYGTYKW